jgi:hypothetical protein
MNTFEPNNLNSLRPEIHVGNTLKYRGPNHTQDTTHVDHKENYVDYVGGNDGYLLWGRNKGNKYILLYIQHPLQA